MNANEEMLAGYADPDASYPDADPDATEFEYRLCWYWCWFMYQNYVLVLYIIKCLAKFPDLDGGDTLNILKSESLAVRSLHSSVWYWFDRPLY